MSCSQLDSESLPGWRMLKVSVVLRLAKEVFEAHQLGGSSVSVDNRNTTETSNIRQPSSIFYAGRSSIVAGQPGNDWERGVLAQKSGAGFAMTM